MNFLDGSLFTENQDKLVITAAPYGPEWIPSDFPEDIPVRMEDQIQKAVDCYDAGATKQEITAVLQLATLQGVHSMCLGGPILLEELEAREGREG